MLTLQTDGLAIRPKKEHEMRRLGSGPYLTFSFRHVSVSYFWIGHCRGYKAIGVFVGPEAVALKCFAGVADYLRQSVQQSAHICENRA